MSSSDVALAWIHACHGQRLTIQSRATPGLLIVLHGNADITGTERWSAEHGDVITLPEHHEYGLASVGPEGFDALHVTFHDDPRSESTRTLEGLLARNEVRAQIVLNNPFFLLLREGGLNSDRRLTTLRECARVFADHFQKLLFARQALCRDDEYAEAFEAHLLEELGHNKLLRVSKNARAFEDPVFNAVSCWFSHQMFVLDNVGKAIVNLVLETAGYYLGALAGPVFFGKDDAKFFDTHAEADAEHKDVGIRLLAGQQPEAYARLLALLDLAWDMLEAMTRRMAQLVEQDETQS